MEGKEVMKGKKDEKKETKEDGGAAREAKVRYLMSPGQNALQRDFSCWTQMEKISLALPGGTD